MSFSAIGYINQNVPCGKFLNVTEAEISDRVRCVDADDEKEHDKYYCLLAPPLIDKPVYVYAHCKANELIGLNNRVFAVPTRSASGFMISLIDVHQTYRVQNVLLRYMRNTQSLSPADVLRRYSGDKLRRYADAFKWNEENDLRHVDFMMESFGKLEKMDKVTDMRFIQHRKDRVIVQMLRHTLPVDDALCVLKGDGVNLPFGKLFSGHLNPRQIAKHLRIKWDWLSQVGKPVAILSDISRYDRSHRQQHLAAEARFYTRANKDSMLSVIFYVLLFIPRSRVAVSKLGIVYTTTLQRYSGETITGGGNKVLVFTAFVCVMHYLRIPMRQWTLLNAGDDNCTLTVAQHIPWISRMFEVCFAHHGYDLRIESIAPEFEQIQFCQCRPVLLSGGWRMIRDPRRVMARATVMTQDYEHLQNRLDYLFSVGMCELANNSGCPVLQAYALCLVRNSPGGVLKARFLEQIRWNINMPLKGAIPTEVTEEARLSFQRAWGIDVETQHKYEKFFSTWKIDVSNSPRPTFSAFTHSNGECAWSPYNPFDHPIF